MPGADAILYRPARYFYEQIASPADQQALDEVIAQLCEDPGVDDRLKFVFPVPPAILRVYDDRRFWVVYHMLNNWTLAIFNIGYSGEFRTPHRPEAAR